MFHWNKSRIFCFVSDLAEASRVLGRGEQTVHALTLYVGVSQPAVSKPFGVRALGYQVKAHLSAPFIDSSQTRAPHQSFHGFETEA